MNPASAKQPPRPALETAFAEHHGFVRERLRGLGVAAADLDDATQDVFEVLVRRIASYDPQRPIRAWMAGMARKVARRYRDRGRRAIVSLDERRPALADSPEDRAAQAEAWQVLQRFIDELEPERWSVFVLSEIEGLRGSEIAVELGVNLNTVYARLRSARQAFERTLRRHRSRERRGLAALFVWPTEGSRRWRWGGSLLGTGGLSLATVIMLAGGRCGAEEEEKETTHEQDQPRTEAPSPATAARLGVAARPSDPANIRAHAPEQSATVGEAWISGGSGVSMSTNAGKPYTLNTETRYRFDGDRMILEVTYIGDDDVDIDATGHWLTLDALELVEGASEWELAIPAGETRVVSTTLEAPRDGVVRLRVTTGRSDQDQGPSSQRDFAWVREDGLLRRCNEHECEAPQATRAAGEARLSGKRITVHVHNECSVIKEFVLFAGYPELEPPESIAVHSLQPDERRVMEIDAAQSFLHHHPDGHIGGGGSTDTDGGRVRFFGEGDACLGIQVSDADAPDLPPPIPW